MEQGGGQFVFLPGARRGDREDRRVGKLQDLGLLLSFPFSLHLFLLFKKLD